MKKLLLSGGLAVLLGAGALVASAAPAAAYVVCNRGGDCWHSNTRYTYHRNWGVTVHDNNWRWRANERYRWREHTGRGYWRGGLWVTF